MTYKPRNYRIISIRTAKRILHVEDCLDLDRIRFELWDYARGEGSHGQAEAYLDRHTARVLAAELATGRLADCDGLEDLGGGTVGGAVVSRIFRIDNSDTKNPIRLSIANGPGMKLHSGIISPRRGEPQTRLQILLSRLDARCIGLALLDHIRAWETHTYAVRVEAGTWQPEPQAPEEEGEPQRVGAPLDSEPPLHYADGTPVTDNPSERQAFQAYTAAEKQIPDDVAALRQWVRGTPSET